MDPVRDNRMSVGSAASTLQVGASAFLLRVYNWMTLGLALTGIVSAIMVANPDLVIGLARQPILFFGLIIAELALVGSMAGWIGGMSASATVGAFLFYSALNGLTLSVVFLAYTRESITSTFFITSATFGAMSAYGYATKRDLTGLGTFCFMGLIGLIIASLVNLFLHNSMLYWWTTFAGVIVFVGLTAYDTQKIKGLYVPGSEGTEQERKSTISGALILYLDFVNLFLIMLRLFGRRRD